MIQLLNRVLSKYPEIKKTSSLHYDEEGGIIYVPCEIDCSISNHCKVVDFDGSISMGWAAIGSAGVAIIDKKNEQLIDLFCFGESYGCERIGDIMIGEGFAVILYFEDTYLYDSRSRKLSSLSGSNVKVEGKHILIIPTYVYDKEYTEFALIDTEEMMKYDISNLFPEGISAITKRYDFTIRYDYPSNKILAYKPNEMTYAVSIAEIKKNTKGTNLLSPYKENIKEWHKIEGIPLYYFYHYVPKRYQEISQESENARKLIWDFKNGKTTSPSATQLVIDKLKHTFYYSDDLSKIVFVCIPASTIVSNQKRYETFSQEVCRGTGMKNAFPHIRILKEKTPSRLTENKSCEPAEYSFDRDFFKGSKVILFDDVVTSGRSMGKFKRYITEMGGEVIGAISLGRTYSDYHGNARTPHPYSGII